MTLDFWTLLTMYLMHLSIKPRKMKNLEYLFNLGPIAFKNFDKKEFIEIIGIQMIFKFEKNCHKFF